MAVHVDAKVLNVFAWSDESVVKIDSCVRGYSSYEWSSNDKNTLSFVWIYHKTVSVCFGERQSSFDSCDEGRRFIDCASVYKLGVICILYNFTIMYNLF